MPETEQDDFNRELEGFTPVATDFGTKIEWAEGVTFRGTFDGFRTVRKDGEDIEAAEFVDTDGERMWSWQPFQLEYALRGIKPGTEVLIRCTGEDDNAPVSKGRNKQLGFDVRKRA